MSMPAPAQRRAAPRSDAIDGLRAIAVLLVLCAHALPKGTPFIPVGVRGVDLFFVISGTCMYLVLQKVAQLRVLPFVAARFARIAPPYYVALAIFAALALTSFGYPTAPSVASTAPADSAHELLADLVFASTPSPIHNVSFWTLGVEMRWYVLCVPLMLVFRRSRLAFAAIGLACYGMYWLTPFGISDEGMLPAFMLGIVAGSLDPAALRGGRAIAIGIATAIALTALFAIDIHLNPGAVDHGSPLWHLGFFGLVVCGRTPMFARVFSWRPLAMTGTASYSIYLVHQPVVEWLARWHPGAPALTLAGLAAGFAFYAVVERPLSRRDRREALAERLLGVLPASLAGRTPALERAA